MASFASGLASDWTIIGSSIAVVSGAVRVTGGGGNASGAYRTIAGLVETAGRAYRLTGDIWRETASNVCLGTGPSGVGTSNYGQTANLTNTTPLAVALYCSGFSPSNASLSVRHVVNPSTGTYWADNFSLREALPYAPGRGHHDGIGPRFVQEQLNRSLLGQIEIASVDRQNATVFARHPPH